ALRKELGSYGRWALSQRLARRENQSVPRMDARLAHHLSFALDQLSRFPTEISGTMRKHQLKLADRQCRMAELSQRLQDVVILMVPALGGPGQKAETAVSAADILCQDLRRLLTGERPPDGYFRDCNKLAEAIIAGGFEGLGDVPQ